MIVDLSDTIRYILENDKDSIAEVLAYVATDAWTPEYVYEELKQILSKNQIVLPKDKH